MERLLARDPEAIAYAVERSCINKVRRGRCSGVGGGGRERTTRRSRCADAARREWGCELQHPWAPFLDPPAHVCEETWTSTH